MKIALALGGGGAKGNAHIGVLRVLEREGFEVGALAGTSMGGLVGAVYLSGLGPDEIEARFSGIDQSQLLGRYPDEGPAKSCPVLSPSLPSIWSRASRLSCGRAAWWMPSCQPSRCPEFSRPASGGNWSWSMAA
jgi:hypothetical protein